MQRIATYLNNLGYRARTGKMWHHATVRGILCNLTYTGVLRCGESRSELLPHLQIIEPEVYETAQRIRENRMRAIEQEHRVPMNTLGQNLLAGNVFCGHCGSRLALTTNGKAYPCKDDPNRVVKRVRYICYGKTRKQTECDGQTGYTAHILDGIIDKVVRQIFERMKVASKKRSGGCSLPRKDGAAKGAASRRESRLYESRRRAGCFEIRGRESHQGRKQLFKGAACFADP